MKILLTISDKMQFKAKTGVGELSLVFRPIYI